MSNTTKTRFSKFAFYLVSLAAGAMLVTVIVLGAGAGACTYAWSMKQDHFDLIRTGDTKDVLLKQMGEPSYSEPAHTTFKRYANEPCQGECVERLWYEVRPCFDVSAWSFEIDKKGIVIGKYHWASP